MRKILGFTAAAALALGLGSLAANAQSPFYQCQFTVNAAGVSNGSANGVCQLDPQRLVKGGEVGILMNFSTGASLTASVEITGDVPVNITGGGNWQAETNLSGKTANAYDTSATPVTGLRLNVTPYTSGTLTLTVVQPAIPKN